ncbi:hypothetical protein UFOVP132_34 [uncultured Caudovirales phage]|uniref:Uncharacterized protein n=1 Tax=uncultured Caudovirales phage TaxID=2100421 RepID=A0A6J5LC22_9CAUD|nr:hypothetical protein UFOVP132_34 [uncultured Caudovirales phage]
MKALVVTPFTPLSKNLASHRSAQGAIYADQLEFSGINVDLAMTGNIPDDYNEYDALYVYHGNDWFGTLNMFGGVKNYANIDSVIKMSKFKKRVYSIDIEYPDYHGMLRERLDRTPDAHPDWNLIDWEGLNIVKHRSTVIRPNDLFHDYPCISVGDSHAICLYRPGWLNVSVPFKTLHGALSAGLESFLPKDQKFTEIDFYFGNIDIRHHLCRFPDPIASTLKLVTAYVRHANMLAEKYDATVNLYEPLPIENESRKIPQTGYYKGKPFHGTWAERESVRLWFRSHLEIEAANTKRVFIKRWVDGLKNEAGELDFKYMEKPQSVHLSREYYPYWQGLKWNGISSLKGFME